MSFFAMPAWEPPSGYRIPSWLRPPETMVPGIVPVELVVARADTQAVLVTDLCAYPTGLAFTLTGRPRPDRSGPPRPDRSGPPRPDPVRDRHHRLPYRNLWLALRFADGQTVSTDPRGWPRTFETEQPDPPFLYYHGVGGSERWQSRHWLWGLPPPGPLAFMWPAGQDLAAGAEIDAGLVLEAADRATTVWPRN